MKKITGTLMQVLFLLAAVWGFGIGIWILMTPQTIYEIQATATNGGSTEPLETTRQVSFYQVQGAWGVFILVVFASLYGLAGFFFLRNKLLQGTVFTVLALVLTYLAGLSIGPYYLPAAAALLVGAILRLGIHFAGSSQME